MGLVLLTERHADQIAGVLSCHDRMLLFGTLPGVCFSEGMTSRYSHKVRILDYARFAEPFRSSSTRSATRESRRRRCLLAHLFGRCGSPGSLQDDNMLHSSAGPRCSRGRALCSVDPVRPSELAASHTSRCGCAQETSERRSRSSIALQQKESQRPSQRASPGHDAELLPHLLLTLLPNWSRTRLAETEAEDGSFDLANIAPRHYTLSGFLIGDNERATAYQQIEVGREHIDDVLLTRAEGAPLPGHVILEGPPPANLTHIEVACAVWVAPHGTAQRKAS